jgi:hypothetical protein
LNFDTISPPCLQTTCLWAVSSEDVSHPKTDQARHCLASETRQARAHLGWYGRRLKISQVVIFFLYHEDLFFPGFCLVGFGPTCGDWEVTSRSGGNQCQLDSFGQI